MGLNLFKYLSCMGGVCMDHDCVSRGEREDYNHVPGSAKKDDDYVPGV